MTDMIENITYEELEAIDVINVDLVPERKGLILKHCEYYVSSRRHGTTVTRRYNDFVQLYDVLSAKYPYRAVCRLPPKRVVVGGGSVAFVRKRRAALQRWLTLAARHPVIGHDADLRSFLCEPKPKLEKPKHDEFELAGTQTIEENEEVSIEDMEAVFLSDQEQLRLVQLGLGRLEQIFEKAEQRCAAETSDIRELSGALVALATAEPRSAPRFPLAKPRFKRAAEVAAAASEEFQDSEECESAAEDALATALEALKASRELGSRLRRGLHGERAWAARTAPHAAALRRRHRYALRAATHEAAVSLAYAVRGAERAAAAFGTTGDAHARLATLWASIHAAATTGQGYMIGS